MKFKKFAARIISAVTASAMLTIGVPAIPVEKAFAADTCVIDTSKEYQVIRGFGGINHPEWTGQDLTPEQRQTAFGNGPNELGFTVLRVFVNPDKNQWYKALPTAQTATEMGVTVFASPWEPPSNLAESGGSNGKLHLPKSNYGAYAQHLNDFGNYMKNNNVDLYAISVQNEPDYAKEWTYWSSDETTEFLANYADKITSTKVMSPESFQYAPENASWISDGGKKFYTKIMNNQKAMANCDLFGTHFYGTQRNWMDFPALENSGKEIWMTEVYVPNSEANSNERWPEAIQVAENIHNGLVVGNMSAYVWWYIRRSYGPMNENGTISKRGYMMAQYSKYVRPGDIRIAATEQPADNVYVSAYKGNDNQLTIVAINKGTTSYSQNFSIGSGEKITDVDRYRSSANENLALTSNLENDGTSFWAQLPGESVSTFVVTLDGEGYNPGVNPDPEPEPEPAPVPDENGYYFHDTFEADTFNWNARGSSSILTSGRTAYADKESLLVQERTSAWHGAGKALNPAAFEPGKEYSFSSNVMYFDGDATDTFYMKLQYTGSDGEAHYSQIAAATAVKGEWVQLANTNYKIPEDATDMLLYIETAESTNNFYIDEAIGAVAGTKIDGAEPVTVIKGDVNFDGSINVFDIISARKGLISGSFSGSVLLAADVDENGKYEAADLVQIQQFVVGKISVFNLAEAAKNDWDNYVETATPQMQKFYSDAIYQMGNTSRLVEKIDKAENGEKVTLAYLGGSITEGSFLDTCYASRSYRYFADTFGTGSNVSFINAGLSGTSSVVGLMRSQRDILDKNPDVIFLEFSVNDHPEEIYKKGFESLVKKCLSQPNNPAVIIIVNRSKGGYSMQEQMAAIGKNYNVPIISMDTALTNAFNSGLLTKDDYYTDEYHPHADGNALISDSIAYFFRQALKTENRTGDYTIPSTTVYGAEYSTGSIVPISELKNFNAGSFKSDNSNNRFAYGYTFQKNSANTPMTFTVNGKGIFLVFKSNQNSSLGNVNVTVNGTTAKINGNRPYAWGGADADVAYMQNTSGELNVSISMENAGSDFTIWGIGVVE